jgi:hypothetical protein
MKTLHFLILLLFFNSVFAQSESRIVVKKTGKTFCIQDEKGKRKISNLKFVKRIAQYYQVLDKNNKIFYINDAFERKDSVEDFHRICGTVPHYKLRIKENDSFFLIYSDETFYDYGNLVKEEIATKISKTLADKVLFINGIDSFDYTSNFTYLNPIIDPNTLVFVKNGKYYFSAKPKAGYDSICFNASYYPSLKTVKNGFYGYYNICPANYKWIGPFKYHLARVQLKNGKYGYIDDEGKLYL